MNILDSRVVAARSRMPGGNRPDAAHAHYCDARLAVRLVDFIVFGHAVLRVLLTLLVFGVAWSGQAGADITATGHNLAKIGGEQGNPDETCVFCHTPRIIEPLPDGSSAGQAAAWQRSLPGGYVFPAADPVASQAKPGDGPASLICLSCHDGTQAPFEGGMHQNHPVGVVFRGWKRATVPEGGGGFLTPMQADQVEKVMKAERKESDYGPTGEALMGDNTIWWVSTTGSTRRQRGDLPLYGRVMPSGERLPNVECASCHDPHSGSKMFLRVIDGGSKLCMSCHTI